MQVLWTLILLLSLAVAAYALGLAMLPELRASLSPLAVQLMQLRPAIAVTHFTGGGIALAIGAVQFSERLRSGQPLLHRWLGRVYLVSILGSGSAGLFMAVYSNADVIARIGFGLLALLWLWTSGQAYRAIRARRVQIHRAWMFRSFALTLAAVTLRIYLPLGQIAGVPFDIAYTAIAWLCWVPNLLIAARLAPLKGLPA